MAKTWQVTVMVMTMAGALFLCAGFWIPAKAVLAQYLLQRAWQQCLTSGNIVKPWPWADTWPIGRLQNERLGIDLIVLEGESGEVLAFGPGHLSQSGSPGEQGHCILAGHRDTSFNFLKDLQKGDLLTLEGKNGIDFYFVQGSLTVRAEDLYLDSEKTGILTLITCYPFEAVMPHTPVRFVVTAMKRQAKKPQLQPL